MFIPSPSHFEMSFQDRLITSIIRAAHENSVSLTRVQAAAISREFANEIRSSLRDTGRARVRDLGTFSVKMSSPRSVPAAPGSAERIVIPARKVLKFKLQQKPIKEEIQSYALDEKPAKSEE